MMFQTIMFGLTMEGTSLQNIVLILLIIAVAVYGYLEIKRLKTAVANLEKILNDRKVPYTPPTKTATFVQSFRPQETTVPISSQTQVISPVEPLKPDLDHVPKESELSELMISDEEEYDSYDLKYHHQDTPPIEKVVPTEPNKEQGSVDVSDSHQISILDDTTEPEESGRSIYVYGKTYKKPETKEEEVDILLTGDPMITPPSSDNEPDSESIDDIKIIQAEAEDSEYTSKTVSELKAILTDMNQPVSGNKTKLIKRIKEHTVVNKV